MSSERTSSQCLPEILCKFSTKHDDEFLALNCFHFQERRDLSQNMKYVELLMVADKAEVRAQIMIRSYVEPHAVLS